MASEFEGKIIQDFARDIAGKLGEAALLARAADSLGGQGLTDQMMQTLLDAEPLLIEATCLLNASLIVRRRERKRAADST